MQLTTIAGATLAALGIVAPDAAQAHGFAGKRFFPATLATEDPFVADELSLPTISYQEFPASGDEPGPLLGNCSDQSCLPVSASTQ